MLKKSVYIILLVVAPLVLCFSFYNSEKAEPKLSHRFASYSDLYNKASNILISKEVGKYETLDSLFYFNSDYTRFVSCLHSYSFQKRFADELILVYGEKINDAWFFFLGNAFTLPRALYNENDSLPLTYTQFHNTALEDIFYPFALSGNFDFKNAPFLTNDAKKTESKGLLEEKF